MSLYRPGAGIDHSAVERLRVRKACNSAGLEAKSLPLEDHSDQWDQLLGINSKKTVRCGVCSRPLGPPNSMTEQMVCAHCSESETAHEDVKNLRRIAMQKQTQSQARGRIRIDRQDWNCRLPTLLSGTLSSTTLDVNRNESFETSKDIIPGMCELDSGQCLSGHLSCNCNNDEELEAVEPRSAFGAANLSLHEIVMSLPLPHEQVEETSSTSLKYLTPSTDCFEGGADTEESESVFSDSVECSAQGGLRKPQMDSVEEEDSCLVSTSSTGHGRGCEDVAETLPWRRTGKSQQEWSNPACHRRKAGASHWEKQTARRSNFSENLPTEERRRRPEVLATTQVWRRKSDKVQAPSKKAALAEEAIQEVKRQLSEPDSKGFVWVDAWTEYFQSELGTLRKFLEGLPEHFEVTPTTGRGYRVRLVTGAGSAQ
eukprot:TRINITY_DN22593_c0_g1_i1.p1 TRINITY_DN22593_c0_g1~~TRINITY_DN22593_c0_g1_i1.p1  ORF type:complete len:427 (-),score=68.97 TRINITY_DN22593_c0_g1_i1:251-1531(-)